MSWTNGYIGIPFEDLGRIRSGCDCWGLARLVYANELQITLPSYAGDYACADERVEIAELIKDAQTSWPWLPRPEGAQPFDILVFRQGRYQSHIGLAVDSKSMLHVAGEDQSKIEPFDKPRWSNRFIGAYYHVDTSERYQS